MVHILWLDESPTCWELTMAYPLENERMFPINRWLEDVFPIEIYRPFFGYPWLVFGGVLFKWDILVPWRALKSAS